MLACRCSCGNIAVHPEYTLLSGVARSCGCLKIEQARRRIGAAQQEIRRIEKSLWLIDEVQLHIILGGKVMDWEREDF